ncbi:MAG: cystathionine beta-synthase, partial [Myroides sp.]|nr:cystathionine beta-synthase [Myroides sp.]
EGAFDENSVVVMLFPDHGSRYMSKIYSDAWMEQQGFLDGEPKNEITYIK